MARWLQNCLLLSTIIIAHMSRLAAFELPYEVLDSIMELSDIDQYFTDLTRVNVSDDRGPTRPIYRLDLDPDYVAYYEIDMGRNYVVLSSGRKTGDFREVESGPDPRPTNVLIQQAQNNGQRCDKFYRLSPLGLTICKNDNETVVAASYNWTADVAEVRYMIFFFFRFFLITPNVFAFARNAKYISGKSIFNPYLIVNLLFCVRLGLGVS